MTDVLTRQRIVRLIVKEVIVSNDGVTIRHSIHARAARPAGRRGDPIRRIPLAEGPVSNEFAFVYVA